MGRIARNSFSGNKVKSFPSSKILPEVGRINCIIALESVVLPHPDSPTKPNTSPFTSYNWHGKGNFATLLDAVVLGATEVDINFNANVVTHSDGRTLHGIGGWQNCLFSKCTILPIPSFRNRIPIIVDNVTTLVGPGELIDVIITERGIAINPLREDLIKATQNTSLPIRKIEEIKEEVDHLTGGPLEKPKFSSDAIGVVKWVDGTLLDTIFKLK